MAEARAAQLSANLGTISAAIKHCNPSNRSVRLVAVSKLKPASDIEVLASASPPHLHFGENYLQELQHKASVLPRHIRWHFIGALQTNKCRPLAETVPNLWAVESVDSAKKADQLEKGRRALRESEAGKELSGGEDGDGDGRLRVFVQVNTSGEESKSGTEPGGATTALCGHIRAECPHLRLQGLMTIGAIARSRAGGQNEDFVALREERERVREELGLGEGELELSMGMSTDYEAAVAQGSDEVRVGSGIFGERPAKESGEAKGEAKEGRG